MNYDLYLLKYNNYFNRIVKREENLLDYLDIVGDNFFKVENVNFAKLDGVNASHTINNSNADQYDYLLVINRATQTIDSRWFILENLKQRGGQYTINLKRDVIVDFFESFSNAPAYIEKGWVQENNPLILNRENVILNQIKKSETLLKDKSNTAWLVGYYQNITEKSINIETYDGDYVTPQEIALDVGISENEVIDILLNRSTTKFQAPDNDGYLYYIGFNSYVPSYDGGSDVIVRATLKTNEQVLSYKCDNEDIGQDAQVLPYIWSTTNSRQWSYYTTSEYNRISNGLVIGLGNNRATKMYNLCAVNNPMYTYIQANKLLAYNDKIIYYNGLYSRITFFRENFGVETKTLTNNNDIKTMVDTMANYESDWIRSNTNQYSKAIVGVRYSTFGTYATSVETSTYNLQFLTTFRDINSKPYKMFAIPLNSIEIRDGNMSLTTDNIGLYIARAISKQYNVSTSSGVFDIQLLPYFPMQSKLNDGYIELSELEEHKDYQYITIHGSGEKKAIIFFPSEDSFTVYLNYQITPSESKKIVANCDNWRIVSPNYQGGFEFNVADNGGSVDYFTAYCTYKPYTPYIKVSPNFKYLYGEDFGDCRGCICGGDFSISVLNSAWVEYELNNKNYQNIFNRDIQNLQFMQGQERVQAGWNIVGGTTSGATSGALTGAVVGGGYGAVAGAIVGGGASLGAGIADYLMLGERQKETLDYAKDKFEMQIGNIKAMPNTLTKVSAFDINSKVFPFLEYYTCTDQERNLFKEKIKYESMKIDAVDNINNYIFNEKHYLKGRIIRLENLNEDNHIASDIYNEFLKGVYL